MDSSRCHILPSLSPDGRERLEVKICVKTYRRHLAPRLCSWWEVNSASKVQCHHSKHELEFSTSWAAWRALVAGKRNAPSHFWGTGRPQGTLRWEQEFGSNVWDLCLYSGKQGGDENDSGLWAEGRAANGPQKTFVYLKRMIKFVLFYFD